MTIERQVTGIICDHPGCEVRLVVPAECTLMSTRGLRELAAAWCGWKKPSSDGDFCPTHATEHP